MTQEEFNKMFLVALQQFSLNGYYTSKYSGEEQDALFDKIAALTKEATQ